jgi:integrase
MLTGKELRRWRDSLKNKGLSLSTVNRTITGLRAALNLAAKECEAITNISAWRFGLAAFDDAEESNNVILPEPVVRHIVGMAGNDSQEFGLHTEVGAVTGARPSQIRRLQVQDLQSDVTTPRLMMPSAFKGRGKKVIRRRPVPIPQSLAIKLKAAAAGRAATAPLLLKPSGDAWQRNDHVEPFKRVVKAAGLDPSVTYYALRHSSIVRQILSGVPIRVVAVNHDTSVRMIEKTYSRHIGDHTDALVRKALLDIDESANGAVVPLRRSNDG